jgi:hypothetical protein
MTRKLAKTALPLKDTALDALPPEAQQQVLSCYGQWQTEGGGEGKPGDVSSVVIV